jgi:hypothetical protein
MLVLEPMLGFKNHFPGKFALHLGAAPPPDALHGSIKVEDTSLRISDNDAVEEAFQHRVEKFSALLQGQVEPLAGSLIAFGREGMNGARES